MRRVLQECAPAGTEPAAMSAARAPHLDDYLLLLVPPLLWAGNAVVARGLAGQLPPLAFSFWRWALALALIAPFGLRGVIAQRATIRRHFVPLLALAVTSVSAYNTMLYLGLQTTSAVSVTLLAAAMPATIMALAAVWLRERLGARQWLGMLVALVGVLVVLGHGDPRRLLGLELHRGDLWAVGANLSWAIYSVMLRRYPTGLDTRTLLTTQIVLGLPCILPFYLFELAGGRTLVVDGSTLAAIAYAGLFASLLAYFLWNRGVAAVGPSVAGQFTYFIPLFTALLAALVLGEHVEVYHGAAFALIVSGIMLANLRLRR
jgi:drug/metabolite transporter (DMT)-like permease